jgi:succinoglycan biosynthesis transport protein ExoP
MLPNASNAMNPTKKSESPTVPAELSFMSLARMIWKRKLLIALAFVILAPVAYFAVKAIPPVYQAEAVILVDFQKISDRFVASTVNTDVSQRLAYIREQILSSDRLTSVLKDFNLIPAQQDRINAGDFAERVRKSITVAADKVPEGRSPSVIRLGFTGRDPEIAAAVANRLANLFIEENLRTREVVSEGTREFIDAQLQEAKQNLDNLESSLSQFKMQFNGELPEQAQQISGALGRLQMSMEANQDAIARANQVITTTEGAISVAEAELKLQHQAAQLRANAAQQTVAGVPINTGTPQQVAVVLAPRQSEIIARQLMELRSKYREGHPEIKRLQAVLEQTRKLEAEQPVRASSPATPSTPDAAAPAAPVENATSFAAEITRLDTESAEIRAKDRIASLHRQIEQAKKEIERRTADQDRLTKEMAAYQAHLERLPIREQQMARLSRDYQTSKGVYQALLDKKMAAEMATELERRQKSERFTLLEPAHVPKTPVSPNRSVFNAIGILAAFAVSMAIGILFEYQKGLLLGEWELPPTTVVLAQLPMISLSRRSGPFSFLRKSGGMAAAASAILICAAMGFYYFSRR